MQALTQTLSRTLPCWRWSWLLLFPQALIKIQAAGGLSEELSKSFHLAEYLCFVFGLICFLLATLPAVRPSRWFVRLSIFTSLIVSTVVGFSFFLLAGSVRSQDLQPSHAIAEKQSSSGDADKLGAEWGKAATPGVHVELVEWKGPLIRYGGGKPRKNDVAYQLVCTGLPQDKTYTVWLLESGQKVPHPFLPGLSADTNGELRTVPLAFQDFAKAEPVDVALVSTDLSVRAFAGTVPFPIRAQDGGCSLSLRFLTKDLRSFRIMIEGFQPGEDIRTISRFESDVSEDHLVVPPDGKSSVEVSPKATAKRSGKASYEAFGKSCHPVLEYEWGRRSYFRF